MNLSSIVEAPSQFFSRISSAVFSPLPPEKAADTASSVLSSAFSTASSVPSESSSLPSFSDWGSSSSACSSDFAIEYKKPEKATSYLASVRSNITEPYRLPIRAPKKPEITEEEKLKAIQKKEHYKNSDGVYITRQKVPAAAAGLVSSVDMDNHGEAWGFRLLLASQAANDKDEKTGRFDEEGHYHEYVDIQEDENEKNMEILIAKEHEALAALHQLKYEGVWARRVARDRKKGEDNHFWTMKDLKEEAAEEEILTQLVTSHAPTPNDLPTHEEILEEKMARWPSMYSKSQQQVQNSEAAKVTHAWNDIAAAQRGRIKKTLIASAMKKSGSSSDDNSSHYSATVSGDRRSSNQDDRKEASILSQRKLYQQKLEEEAERKQREMYSLWPWESEKLAQSAKGWSVPENVRERCHEVWEKKREAELEEKKRQAALHDRMHDTEVFGTVESVLNRVMHHK